MLNFENNNASFLICPNFTDDVLSFLYSKSYSIFPIQKIENKNIFENYICINLSDNTSLLSDVSTLVNKLNINSVIVKYFEDNNIYEIFNDHQRIVEVKYYSDESDIKYIHENYVFSFLNKKIYNFPTAISDFKEGMIVECLSNDNWIKRRVNNVSTEFDKIYKLLIKYNKIRIPV